MNSRNTSWWVLLFIIIIALGLWAIWYSDQSQPLPPITPVTQGSLQLSSPQPQIMASSTASTTPAAKTAMSMKPNPFEAYYNALPQGGSVQSCLKAGLGSKFGAAYYEGIVPSTLMQTNAGCIGNTAETPAKLLTEYPAPVELCFEEGLGSNLSAFVQEPTVEAAISAGLLTQSAEQKIATCPAYADFSVLLNNLSFYVINHGTK